MSLERREFLPVLEADNMVGLDRSADRDGGLLFFDRCFDGRPETGERGVNIADQRRQVGHADAVVRYMRRNAVDRIVFSSSAAVYGEPESTPMTERHPRHPLNPIGEASGRARGCLYD